MKQENIIAAIAAYLEHETIVTGVPGSQEIQFGGVLNQGHFTHSGFCKEVAKEIAAAIAPHLKPSDYPYNKLSDHRASENGLTFINTELGDIIHIARK